MHIWQYIFRTKKFGFPGQMEGEVVEFFTPRHMVVLVPLISILILFIFGLVVLDFLWIAILPPVYMSWLIFFNSVFLIFIVHVFFLRCVNSMMNIMIVTNFRVLRVKSTVFLHRERNVLHMKNIQDIEMYQSGILPRLFDYGHIVITSASGEYELNFYYTPHTQKVYNILNHICQKVVQKTKTQSVERQNFTNP